MKECVHDEGKDLAEYIFFSNRMKKIAKCTHPPPSARPARIFQHTLAAQHAPSVLLQNFNGQERVGFAWLAQHSWENILFIERLVLMLQRVAYPSFSFLLELTIQLPLVEE